jgi:serine/threonine protein kinase/formylglycine-generating enzyme required for sulfatase activity
MTNRLDDQEEDAPTQATRYVPKEDLPGRAEPSSSPGGKSEYYDLLGKISDGGQAVIYKARDKRSGQIVAIKLFKTMEHDPQAGQRLMSEAEILFALKHPNIINEMGTVEVEDEWGSLRRGMVMEYLEGITMKEWVARNPKGTPWHQARPIMEQCIAGLDYALKTCGVVHRDIKPSNIIIMPDGVVKLIDFGVAHAPSEDTRTSSGLLGSFDYMAPEFSGTDTAFRGDVVSDIFGLFVCFYELLTGKLPFPKFGERPDIEFMARWKGTPPQVSHASIIFRVMAHLSKFMERGLAADRSKRFQTYEDVLQQLKDLKKRIITNGKEQYMLLDGLGSGAFGEVFKARCLSNNTFVAIKRLFPDRSGDKFIKEARILAKTQHPGVVKYLDFFQSGGDTGNASYFLVMEYLDGMPGSSLRDRIKANATGLPLAEVIPTFLQYAAAIGQLHYQGIIHRDIKPANLYARKDSPDLACILDLGVARDLSGTKTTGSVPGSWDYMAPELLAENTRGSPRSDLYALGLSLYEAITGGPAYPRLPRDDREAYPELIARAKGTSSHSISFTDSVFEIYPELAKIISRLCAQKPSERPNDAREMFNDLLAFGVARLKLDEAVWKDRIPPAMPEARGSSSSKEAATADVIPPVEAKSSAAKMPVVAAAVAMLVAAGGGVWWWTNQSKNGEATIAPATQVATTTETSAQPARAPETIVESKPAESPAPPAVNAEAVELARQIEILYRLYPVSFGYESFERDIYQRVRSLNDLLGNVRDASLFNEAVVKKEMNRFWAKMTEYALSEATAQNNPAFFSIVRECINHGVRLTPEDGRDGIARASALFKTWQDDIPRLTRTYTWPLSASDLLGWNDVKTPYLDYLVNSEAGRSLKAALLPARLDAKLNTAGGRGIAERALTLPLALVPDASFPEGTKHASPESPFYMAMIETPVEALRIFRDDASRLTEDQKKIASGAIDPQKTQGRADAPYDQATPDEAMEFSNWLSMRAGLAPAYQRTAQGWTVDLTSPGFRLPTVSEWVFAARCSMDFLAMPGQPSWAQWSESLAPGSNAATNDADPSGENSLVYFLYKKEPRGSANSPEYPLGFRDLAGNVAELCMVDPPDSAKAEPFTPQFVTKGGNAATKAAAAVMPEFRGGKVDDISGMIGFRVVLPMPFSQFESATPSLGANP